MKVEQAMILAAGRGERMMPLTRDLPKPLFEVGDTTLIQRHLQRLAAAGIRRVVINVHYLADMIMARLGAEQFGIKIHYSEEPELLETAGGIKRALSILGDEPFLIVNGDIYTDFPFQRLTAFDNEGGKEGLESHRLPHLIMVKNPQHHPKGDFAVGDHGLLRKGGEELRTYSGIGVYTSAFFQEMSEQKLMLRPLFEQAIAEARLYGSNYDGLWTDIGTPERYEALKAQLQ